MTTTPVSFVSKETTQRLLKDVKHIMKNPLTDQGIYYVHDDTDMLKGYAMIVGPADTPYFGGFYFFEFKYPCDYPHSPPKVTYCTNGNNIRFNPNLYCCGKVCISLLNTWRGDQWTSCQSISTVLLTLCTLLCANPLLNEPGVTLTHKDMAPYNEIIEFSNINIAVCDIVAKRPGVYLPFFEYFSPYIQENFLKHCDQLMSFVQLKLQQFGGDTGNMVTGYYCLNVTVDYRALIEKLTQTRNLLL
jgi:ubiquitin-protein ligase